MPKYGDINPVTNLVFVQRGRTYPDGEYWVTSDVFDKRRKSISEKNKARMASDEDFAKKIRERSFKSQSRPEAKKRRVDRHKQNMKSDPVYAIKFLTRMRLASLKKRKGINRSNSSRKMLGADPWVCKKFIEDQFSKGMSWANRGEWHIDHFFPISLANNEAEVLVFSHFTNLQPLWAVDNLNKRANIPHPLKIIERDALVESWIRTHQMQQMQNAEIGRIGTDPAQMGGVTTQGMQQ
jgi:hypothetical protein